MKWKQVAKLERVKFSRDRRQGEALIETLEARRSCHSEAVTGKVMNGGGVKALPRCPEKDPKELKLKRGSESQRGNT